jgi:hypothetical protein
VAVLLFYAMIHELVITPVMKEATDKAGLSFNDIFFKETDITSSSIEDTSP